MHIFAWSPNPYAPKNRRRPMVTPVHRFQQVDSSLISHRGRFDGGHGIYGRGRRWVNRSRVPRPFDEVDPTRIPSSETCALPSSTSAPSEREGHVVTSTHQQQRPTLPNNFNRFKMGSVNWGLWACFIVVTVLLVPAHIYLKQYAYRGELMGIFFVITLLFLVCFSVSMFHTKTRTILLHRLHLEEEMRACPVNAASLRASTDHCGRPTSNLRSDTSSQHQIRSSRSTPDLYINGDSRIGVEDGSRSQQSGDSQAITRSISETSRASDMSSGWDPSASHRRMRSQYFCPRRHLTI